MTAGRFAVITLIVLVVGEVYPPVAWVYGGLIMAALIFSIVYTQFIPIRWKLRWDAKQKKGPSNVKHLFCCRK